MSGRRNRGKRIGTKKRRSIAETIRALHGFGTRAAIHGKRMSVLKELADVRLDGVCREVYVLMRAQSVITRRKWPNVSPCFVCGEDAKIVHHIIQLQNGGADIEQNKVPLCDPHHADVHVWLTADGEQEPNIWGPSPEPVAVRKVVRKPGRLWQRTKRVVQPAAFDTTPRLVRHP